MVALRQDECDEVFLYAAHLIIFVEPEDHEIFKNYWLGVKWWMSSWGKCSNTTN